jgi:uncharacterized membrane protein YciS (DUF1049 family)
MMKAMHFIAAVLAVLAAFGVCVTASSSQAAFCSLVIQGHGRIEALVNTLHVNLTCR